MNIEQLILDEPDNPELFLVYADTLQQKGDPLGELISLHYALSHVTEHERLINLRNSYNQLINSHPTLLPTELREQLELTLLYGFIQRAWIYRTRSEAQIGSASEQLESLLRSPCSRFIRELTFELSNEEQPDPWAIMAASSSLYALHTLTINDQRRALYRRRELMDPLWEAAPRLRHLQLRGYCPLVHQIDHQQLEHLEIGTHQMPQQFIDSLLDSHLPNLHTLIIDLTPVEEIGLSEQSIERFILEFDAPALRTLAIRQTPFSSQIAKLLPDSLVLAKLEVLDLSAGSLSDDGGRAILSNTQAFQHLQRLDLRSNWLVHTIEPLQQLGNWVQVTGQHTWANLRV